MLRHDADRTVCMAVAFHIAGNVRVSDACRLDGMIDAPGQLSDVERREESMVPGATGAKESARVGHAHP